MLQTEEACAVDSYLNPHAFFWGQISTLTSINVMNAWNKTINKGKRVIYFVCMCMCICGCVCVWMGCVGGTRICVQLCAQKWECMYKGQTRTSDVLLSASLPYSLGTVTLINPEDSRLSTTSVVRCPNWNDDLTQVRRKHKTQTNSLRSLLEGESAHRPWKNGVHRESKDGTSSF